MKGAIAFAALLLAAVPVAAQEAAPTYAFFTRLIPQDGHLPSPPRLVKDAWVKGSLFTTRTGRLAGSLAIGGDYPVLGADALFGYARSDKAIACTVDRIVKKGGHPHLCLADRDGDGRFDAWFAFMDEIMVHQFSRKVPFAKMVPLPAPMAMQPVREADLGAVTTRVGFEIVPRNGRLEFCRSYKGKNDGYCTHNGPSLDKSGQWQNVTLRDAEFRYRKVGSDYEVETLRPMTAQAFL